MTGVNLWLKRARDDAQCYFEDYDQFDIDGRTSADSNGRFCFEGVRGEAWRLGPAADRKVTGAPAVATYAELISIPRGSTEHEVILQVWRDLFLRGKVVDPAGNLVPEATVTAESVESGCWTSTRSTDGQFTLGPILPGKVELVAEAEGLFADSAPVVANAGDENIVLALGAGGIVLANAVDSLTGELCAADFVLTKQGSTIGETAGMYFWNHTVGSRWEGLALGTYDLFAHAGDGRAGIVRNLVVAAGVDASDVTVRLERGATLDLVYKGEAARPLVQLLSEQAMLDFQPLTPGRSSTHVILPGRTLVRLFVDIDTPSRTWTVTLAAGERKSLILSERD